MGISRVKTWNPGDVLTASDLNSEFNNILNNGTTLAFPLTSNVSGGGFTLSQVILSAPTLSGTAIGTYTLGGSGTFSPLQLNYTKVTPTYGASVTINAALGNLFVVTVTDANAFTITNPTNGLTGQTIILTIRNTSGGGAGVLTFGTAYKTGAAWTQPATANSRSIHFYYDGTNWIEFGRSAADVSN